MIVADTSAIIAVLLNEPEEPLFLKALVAAERRLFSCVSLYEARIVMLGRLGSPGVAQLDAFISKAPLELVSFDEAQANLAHSAYARFGKGRHPARLNLADCAAYALARSLAAPLLFKGDDFRLTDVTPAL